MSFLPAILDAVKRGRVEEAERETVYVKTVSELRRWFEKNHARSPGVWVIINKKDSSKPGVYYKEALCFAG